MCAHVVHLPLLMEGSLGNETKRRLSYRLSGTYKLGHYEYKQERLAFSYPKFTIPRHSSFLLSRVTKARQLFTLMKLVSA